MKIKGLVLVVALAVLVFTAVSSDDAFAKGYGRYHGGYACCGAQYTAPAYHGCGAYGGYWPGLYMGPYGKYRPGYGRRGAGLFPGFGGISMGWFGGGY